MNKFNSYFNILTITAKNDALGPTCTSKCSNLIFNQTWFKSKIRNLYMADYLNE
jgi:hypothetical protein